MNIHRLDRLWIAHKLSHILAAWSRFLSQWAPGFTRHWAEWRQWNSSPWAVVTHGKSTNSFCISFSVYKQAGTRPINLHCIFLTVYFHSWFSLGSTCFLYKSGQDCLSLRTTDTVYMGLSYFVLLWKTISGAKQWRINPRMSRRTVRSCFFLVVVLELSWKPGGIVLFQDCLKAIWFHWKFTRSYVFLLHRGSLSHPVKISTHHLHSVRYSHIKAGFIGRR